MFAASQRWDSNWERVTADGMTEEFYLSRWERVRNAFVLLDQVGQGFCSGFPLTIYRASFGSARSPMLSANALNTTRFQPMRLRSESEAQAGWGWVGDWKDIEQPREKQIRDDQSSLGSKEKGSDLPITIFLKSGCAGLRR